MQAFQYDVDTVAESFGLFQTPSSQLQMQMATVSIPEGAIATNRRQSLATAVLQAWTLCMSWDRHDWSLIVVQPAAHICNSPGYVAQHGTVCRPVHRAATVQQQQLHALAARSRMLPQFSFSIGGSQA